MTNKSIVIETFHITESTLGRTPLPPLFEIYFSLTKDFSRPENTLSVKGLVNLCGIRIQF